MEVAPSDMFPSDEQVAEPPQGEVHTTLLPYTKDEEAKIKSLRAENSSVDLLCAYYMSRTGGETCPLFHDTNIVTFVKMFSVMGPLGAGSDSMPIRWGDKVNKEKALELRHTNPNMLAAALGSPKTAVREIMTNCNLIKYVADCLHAYCIVDYSDEQRMQIITIEAPGLGTIVMHNPDDSEPYVVKGGKEFIENVNKTYGRNIIYYDCNKTEIQAAHFLAATCQIVQEKTNGKLSIIMRGAVDETSFTHIPLTSHDSDFIETLRSSLANVYRGSPNAIPQGLQHKKDQRTTYMVILHELAKIDSKIRAAMANVPEMLKVRKTKAEDKCKKLIDCVENPAVAKTPMIVGSGDKQLPLARDYAEFKASTHALHRAPRKASDIKKSDQLAGSGFIQSRSSVAYKFAAMREILKGEDQSLPIVAYGVAEQNHWEQVLGVNVSYFDINAGLPRTTPGGANVEIGDVMLIAPGSLKGKAVYDDTKTQNDPRKAKVIAESGCEYAIIKFLYGTGDDGSETTTSVPAWIRDLRKTFNSVEFVTFTRHSGEAYILCSKRYALKTRWCEIPRYVDDTVVDKPAAAISERDWELKVAGFRRVKAILMYKYNIVRSIEAVNGLFLSDVKIVVVDRYKIDAVKVKKIPFNGIGRMGKIVGGPENAEVDASGIVF